MKKILIVVLLITLCLLILAGCQEEILTYDNTGTITIEVLNDDILARDVTVRTSLDSEIERSGKIITITQNKLLRNVISLSVDEYISRNIVVKSTDFSQEKSYSTEVMFEESYISLELTVITDAPFDDIEIEGDKIISYKSQGNVYDIKLSNDEAPSITVSAGGDYKNYSFTLTEEEVNKGISSRVIMLLDNDYTMIVINIDAGYVVNCYSDAPTPILTVRRGNQALYSVNKNHNVDFRVYDEHYMYVGQKTLYSDTLYNNDIISLDVNSLDVEFQLIITPYSFNQNNDLWYLIAEKDGEGYIPVHIQYSSSFPSHHYNVFSPNKEYYIFSISEDGKIRYKTLNFDEAEDPEYMGHSTKRLNINFDDQDPIRDVTVEIIDFRGAITDFSGAVIRTNNDDYLGTVDSGNTTTIDPTSSYTYLKIENLPNNYSYFYARYLYNQTEEYFYELTFDGIYRAYVYEPFDLTISIESNGNYEGYYIYDYENSSTYYVDNNNTITIENFRFNNYYTLTNGFTDWHFGSVLENINISQIIIDEENYYVTIDLNNPY